jgi:YGGT family
MEESRMPNNPYSDDPINAQMTDVISPMPELPGRQVTQTPPVVQETSRDEEEEQIENRQEEAGQIRYVIGKVNDFLQWFVLVLVIALAVRFLFKLIGADPTNIFAGFLYALTDVILIPFNNLVSNPIFHPNQSFEWTTLFGIGLYALIFWLLKSFVRLLVTEPKEPVA